MAVTESEARDVAIRAHQRYRCHKSELFCINGNSAEKIDILNISYGGVLLGIGADEIKPHLSQDDVFSCTLVAHKQKIRCKLQYIYEVQKGRAVGCSFVHSDDDVLIFLRKFLEYYRIGSTLTLKRDVDGFKESGKKVYHGYEGTLLTVEPLAGENQYRFTLRFKSLLSMLEIELEDGSVQAKDGTSLSPLVLEQALIIMAGFVEQEREAGGIACLDHLKLKLAQVHDV